MTNFESKLKEAARKYSEPFKRGREFKKLSEYARADFTNGALYAESELNAKILLLERENESLKKALKWRFELKHFVSFVPDSESLRLANWALSDLEKETLSALTKSKGGVK